MKYLILGLSLSFSFNSFGQQTNKIYYFKQIGFAFTISSEFVPISPETPPEYLDENGKVITDSVVLQEFVKEGHKSLQLLAVHTPDFDNSIEIQFTEISDALVSIFGDSVDYIKNTKKYFIDANAQPADKPDTLFTTIKIGKFVFQKFYSSSIIRNRHFCLVTYFTKMGNNYISILLEYFSETYGDRLMKAIENPKVD
jgi:hypothetical protein